MCTPAKLYLCIAVLASVFALYEGIEVAAIGMKLLFAIIWTFILSWFCKNGLSNLSWFLVLFPYIVILLAAFHIINITEHRGIFRSLGIQGAYGQEAFYQS
jgi:hypothetical protein